MGQKRVMVVGSCIADTPIDVPALPEPGETVLGHTVGRLLGGKGANQAVALRRLGVEVGLVASIGVDEAGEAFHALLGLEGINDFLVEKSGMATGVGVPLILPTGENAIVVAPGAALALSAPDVEAAVSRFGDFDALLMQLEISDAAAMVSVALGREMGVPVFLNAAPARDVGRRIAPDVEFVVMNLQEATFLTRRELDDPDDVLTEAMRMNSGPRASLRVVTMGSSGVAFASEDASGLIPAFEVEAIDVTGAGDAFCAALVASVLAGASARDAVIFAAAAGGLAVTQRGAISGMPTGAEVRRLLGDDQGP